MEIIRERLKIIILYRRDLIEHRVEVGKIERPMEDGREYLKIAVFV